MYLFYFLINPISELNLFIFISYLFWTCSIIFFGENELEDSDYCDEDNVFEAPDSEFSTAVAIDVTLQKNSQLLSQKMISMLAMK